MRAGASPGVLAVHFAFVVVQERHWEDVVGDGSGDELAQHLGNNIDTAGWNQSGSILLKNVLSFFISSNNNLWLYIVTELSKHEKRLLATSLG